MLGGRNKDGHSKSVPTCSLTNLLQSCGETSPDSVWHRITNVPVYCSTCAAVNGELVAVGGLGAGSENTSAVHKYNPTTDSGISSAICQLLAVIVLLQSSQPMR